MIMRFIKVPKEKGEEVRRQLAEAGILAKDYPILHESGHILFPVDSGFQEYEVVEREVDRLPERHHSLKETLKGVLDEDELASLTTSFDIVGDIAVVEIPKELEPKENEIGQALLKVHKNLRTVLKKLGAMEGEYRVRRVKAIAGEEKTETTYKEHGVSMRLDLSKVYFSVRLSTERKRVSDLVRGKEKVLVLFAGVGPFALVIAKDHPDSRITAVELNPAAAGYMRRNVSMNGFDNIEVLEGDARDFKYSGYDRVVMPLPHSAEEFLDLAYNAIKPGGTIHFYTIVGSEGPFENAEGKIPLKGYNISGKRIVRPYSPDMVQVVLDLEKPADISDQ